MMTGRHRVGRLCACTDCRRFLGSIRAGKVSAEEIGRVKGRLAMSSGTCPVRGTA